MTKTWSLLLLAVALPLGACSQSQSRQVVENGAGGGAAGNAGGGAYPARLALGNVSLPMQEAPLQPADAVWRSDGAGAHFGVAGQPDLLGIACVHGADGTALLRLTRTTRAQDGAKALFALIGNGRITRLPIDAVRAGEQGEWQATVPAADARLDVLLGGNRIEGTLPGGGTLLMPASTEPGRLLTECRATDRGPQPATDPGPPPAQPAGQSLPNLPS